MAKPRIFISSTYYDLKHIRSSLENFIDSLGFEAILSEKGDIAYSPEIPLDESCYREAANADIFIIIIGGRYGTEKSSSKNDFPKEFSDRYESITKKEYFNAVERDIPAYILIEKTVYSDFETFLKNKDNESINYAHVDSVNIFYLIEDILTQPKNNPVHQFDRFIDIENWLKEQWSGLFRELINQRSKQTQIASLASQVNELAEINKTLKRYLEEVMSKVSPDIAVELIENESKRLEETQQAALLSKNVMVRHLKRKYDISLENFRDNLISSKSIDDFAKRLRKLVDGEADKKEMYNLIRGSKRASSDINRAREVLHLDSF